MRGSARVVLHRCVWRPLNVIHAYYHMAFHGLGPRSPQGDTAIRWSIFHLETSLQNTSRLRRSLSVTRHLCRVYRFGFAEPGTSASSRPVRRKAVRFKRSPSPATRKSSSRPHPKLTPSLYKHLLERTLLNPRSSGKKHSMPCAGILIQHHLRQEIS